MTYRAIIIPEQIVTPVSEPAPVIQWLKVADLVVDERYQRPLYAANWKAITKIATEFMWSRFSAVLVAPIEGGRYAIIDGQHRVHAAAMRGIEQVPAMIVLIRSEEQAKAFVDVNTKTVRIHALTIYKAALTAGDDWAVKARDAVEAAGCTLLTRPMPLREKKPGDLNCVALVRDMVQAGRSDAVTISLKALMAFEPGNPLTFSDYVLKPLITAVASFGEVEVGLLLRTFAVKRPAAVVDAAVRYADSTGENRAAAAKTAFRVLIKKTAEA